MESAIKVLKHGLRVNGGKLQRCWYSKGSYKNLPDGTITIYAKDYAPFSREIHEVFAVENNTEIMTDYFEKDRIRVLPSHPMYAAIAARA